MADFPVAGLFGRGRRSRVCSPANCRPGLANGADACAEPPASQLRSSPPENSQPESSQPIGSPPNESADSDQPAAANANAESSPQKSESGWRSLFDGRSLTGWKPAEFGGEGEVGVKDGAMVLDMGYSMTGITSTDKDLPKTNYELSLEAKRLDGTDFFCGLTFPVGDTHCSFIVGGWAGGVVGLSSIDGLDASENQTTKYREFKTDQWYRVRVRVTPERIQTWIDDQQFVDQEIADKRVHIRVEMELSRPLGVATWETKAALRNVRIRRLPE
ncbi:MAG: DUF1080 domain-containing protein [Planctomycetales bacterium]|nr:DUF1080 domain-containing protein [Planctomycetales bacterium]